MADAAPAIAPDAITHTIALDVMSGDKGAREAVAAARLVQNEHLRTNIILVGDEAVIRRELQLAGDDPKHWQIVHAGEVVAMDELPGRAIRKRDTSMRRALELVKDRKAAAAVSAGNTGALMGLGVLLLRMIDGISRPAIAAFIPNRRPEYSVCMLDLGANVSSSPAMLRDFALMGTALVQAVKRKEKPTVGLLNIGEEVYKGDDNIRSTLGLLSDNPHINFVGNVEGHAIYRSDQQSADVVVCGGFSGNVALKVSEGVAKTITGILHDTVHASPLSKFFGLLAYPLLSQLRRRLDHRRYNGASFLGLRGVLVKSHGNADKVGLAAAINVAIDEAERDLPELIRQNVSAAIAAAAAAETAAGAAAETTVETTAETAAADADDSDAAAPPSADSAA